MDYRWWLFLHVGSVLVFMLAHGVQVMVTWKKRWEADPQKNLALFEPLPDVRWLRYSALAVAGSGLLLIGFTGLWTALWVWASLTLLVAIWVLMYRWGGAYYTITEQTAESVLAAAGTLGEAEARLAFERARRSWMVPAMTAVGIGGVAVILWLMIFKPA